MLALGVAMILLGGALLIAEAHLPSFGALGVAGIACLAAGAGIALDASGAGGVTAVALAGLVAAAGSVTLYAVARRVAATVRQPPASGAEALVGHVGVVRRAPEPLGQVYVDGALWRARRSWADEDDALEIGDHVVVERVSGLTLAVRRADEWELEP